MAIGTQVVADAIRRAAAAQHAVTQAVQETAAQVAADRAQAAADAAKAASGDK
jgi:hypothetical protein